MSSKVGSSTICAFLALELSKTLQVAFSEEIERLEKVIAGVQWMEPRRMHLTLRFLGWTTRERLACLEPYLVAAAKACPPLDGRVAGLGTFPPSAQERARVLWAGITLPAAGKALQAACEKAAIECGFPPERRSFQPHLTLGRFTIPTRLRSTLELDLGPTRLDNLVLFRTEPSKEASMPGVRRPTPAYAKLATYPLAG